MRITIFKVFGVLNVYISKLLECFEFLNPAIDFENLFKLVARVVLHLMCVFAAFTVLEL